MFGGSSLVALVVLSGQLISADTHSQATLDDVAETTLGGSVSRATFTRAVVNREPVDYLIQVTQPRQHLYFFSELKGLTGDTVKHRWEADGQIVAEYPFSVGGPKWRIWSSHTIDRPGTWVVKVVNARGVVLKESNLQTEKMNTSK